jgi:hypothetical protein
MLKKYFGKGILVLSVSSQLLFGASEFALASTGINLSSADSQAKEIISDAPLGWRLKTKEVDSVFRTVFSSEANEATNERARVEEWQQEGKTAPHHLAPMIENMHNYSQFQRFSDTP